MDTQGDIPVPILNELGIAATTAHGDFAYGPAHLQQRVASLNYPLLAANVYDTTTGDLVYFACQIFEVAGLRVGVIGLACPIVDKTMPAHFSQGVRFTDGTVELPRYVADLLPDAALQPYDSLREAVGVVSIGLHRGTAVECPMYNFLL